MSFATHNLATSLSPAQPLGQRMLSALETKLVVAKDMRAFILSIPDNSAILPSSKKDEIVSRITGYVWLFGNRKALAILQELEHVSHKAFAFYPKDVSIRVDGEVAVVHARHEGARLAVRMGFSAVTRTQMLTAASELTRNIYMYAGSGRVDMKVRTEAVCGIELLATDNGPGIPNLDQIMSGNYRSKSGLGLGIRGVKEIAKEFAISTSPTTGTTVRAFFSS